MKNLFAAASYSFNNFYNNLNTQGQMIFSIIMLLIIILCAILLVTYIVQSVQAKKKLKQIKEENKIRNIKKEEIRLDTKKMLDEMHKQKIDMSDEIYVINLNGYIGESTKSEIEYANSKGKNISYLE